MKLIHFFSLAIFVFISCNEQLPDPVVTIDSTVRNFGLYDHNGDFHRLYYYDDASAVVIFVQGNSCRIVRKSIEEFESIRGEYEERGVRFFMVNSNLQDSRETIAKEAREFGIVSPILVDEDQLLADILDIRITAEAFVLDPKDWTIQYRGPLNDRLGYGSDKGASSQNYLTEALESFLNDGEGSNSYVRTKGCAIARMDQMEDYGDLTYVDDIAPIIADNCVRCHQVDGIAPWAMNGYPAIVGWSAMMREMLTTKLMPPWQADPHIGVFANDISLDRSEIRKLIAWIDGPKKRGEGADILEQLEPSATKWFNGTPDYIVKLAEETIPSTGIIDYRYQTIQMDLESDEFVRAVEVKPGNPTVLHHVLARVQYPTGQTHPVPVRGSEWLDGLLVGWAPGGETENFPEGSGRKIPKGSNLILQLHYTTSGRKEVDNTRIGFYFHDEKPGKEYIVHGPADFNLKIPPYVKNHPVVAEERFDRPVKLYAMLPHMHYRGRSMKYVAIYPDGTEEVVLSVPDYNFNWQRFYYLENPKSLPAGSRLRIEATFDNSEQNAFNPDPSKTLYFGDQTFDEMMIGYMSFTYEDGSISTL